MIQRVQFVFSFYQAQRRRFLSAARNVDIFQQSQWHFYRIKINSLLMASPPASAAGARMLTLPMSKYINIWNRYSFILSSLSPEIRFDIHLNVAEAREMRAYIASFATCRNIFKPINHFSSSSRIPLYTTTKALKIFHKKLCLKQKQLFLLLTSPDR